MHMRNEGEEEGGARRQNLRRPGPLSPSARLLRTAARAVSRPRNLLAAAVASPVPQLLVSLEPRGASLGAAIPLPGRRAAVPAKLPQVSLRYILAAAAALARRRWLWRAVRPSALEAVVPARDGHLAAAFALPLLRDGRRLGLWVGRAVEGVTAYGAELEALGHCAVLSSCRAAGADPVSVVWGARFGVGRRRRRRGRRRRGRRRRLLCSRQRGSLLQP
mmetsp:Transcript_891/g.2847  ORF Transcript_891/g.2847 Transcript_891/m.2847 type:complete len:219 (+) Transcript_891:137-793(+)